jgi:phospholipid transport system substrate-binding protein
MQDKDARWQGKDNKALEPTRWAAALWCRRAHMQSWSRHVLVSVLVGSLLLAGPLRWAEAGEPQEKVKGTVDEVVAILANHTLPPPERRTKIRQAVLQRFGFEEMAQRTLAQHWRTLTPPQRQEFVELFTDLLEGSYVNRMLNANPESRSVRYVKETIDQDQAVVHTEIGNPRDAPATVEYRLLHKEGDWKVYDIVIEGISLVNNYRTQFNTIITKDSYAGLVKQMRLKRDQEKAGAAAKG